MANIFQTLVVFLLNDSMTSVFVFRRPLNPTKKNQKVEKVFRLPNKKIVWVPRWIRELLHIGHNIPLHLSPRKSWIQTSQMIQIKRWTLRETKAISMVPICSTWRWTFPLFALLRGTGLAKTISATKKGFSLLFQLDREREGITNFVNNCHCVCQDNPFDKGVDPFMTGRESYICVPLFVLGLILYPTAECCILLHEFKHEDP